MVTDFFKKKTAVGVYSTYTLTPLGKDKAETYASSTPWAEVLAYLNEHNSASVSEISRELKMQPKKVRIIITNMIQSGYVRKANPQGD